jgi:hypothetical protein
LQGEQLLVATSSFTGAASASLEPQLKPQREGKCQLQGEEMCQLQGEEMCQLQGDRPDRQPPHSACALKNAPPTRTSEIAIPKISIFLIFVSFSGVVENQQE